MEDLQKKVCLLNEYCLSLEKQKESYKRELETYHGIQDIFRLHDQYFSQLDNVKKQKHQIVGQYLANKEEVARLIPLEAQLHQLQSKYSEQVQWRNFLQRQQEKLRSEIQILNQQLQEQNQVFGRERQQFENLLKVQKAQQNSQRQSLRAQINKLQQKNIYLEYTNEIVNKDLAQIIEEKETICKQVTELKKVLHLKEEELKLKLEKDEDTNSLKEKFEKAEESFRNEVLNWQNKERKMLQKIKRLQQLIKEYTQSHTPIMSTMIDHQLLCQKNKEISTLREIINQQEQSLQQFSNQVSALTLLVQNKEKEIESLEYSNSLLKKQIITTISNEQATIKEMLCVKEESRSNIQLLQSTIAKFKSLKGSSVNEDDGCPSSPKSIILRPFKERKMMKNYQSQVYAKSKFKELVTRDSVIDNKSQDIVFS